MSDQRASEPGHQVLRPAIDTITFYGSSDDLVEVGKLSGWSEEYNVNPKPVTGKDMVWHVTSVADDMVTIVGMRVRAAYDGAWSFAIGPCWFNDPDKPQPFPDWPIRFRQGEPASSYSIVLEIEAPPYTTVTEAING